ncbi:MAG: hypothetical protein IRZ31_13270 [Thermogemmatispora sp.]|uniref:Uncharacterized protein n=1 Tax=Thermogemmatispora tikiterensis TaxID=1825093 RepID=A0A328VKR9_9CHLR|nr:MULTISPECIES: hypothetical protein [Thermogemmatispora]MBX5457865.1 hypothetical protein [Thermogemmatispora sp.]RAQ94805.1 hypothetical protein A4R35_04605 [Thermogemmatispora tikiterensis]
MATSPQPLTGAREQSLPSCPRCCRQNTIDLNQPAVILSPQLSSPGWSQQLRRLLSPAPTSEPQEARA